MSALDGRIYYGLAFASSGSLPSNGTMDNLTITTTLTDNGSITIKGDSQLTSATFTGILTAKSDLKCIRANTGTQAGITCVTGSNLEWVVGSGIGTDSLTITNGLGQLVLEAKQDKSITISGTSTLGKTDTQALTCTTFAPSGTSTMQKTDTQALTCTTFAPSGTSTMQKTDTQALSCTTFHATGAVTLDSTLTTSTLSPSVGVNLPTTGGLQTLMNYFEIDVVNIEWSGVFTAGPGFGPTSFIVCMKINTFVIMDFDKLRDNGGGKIAAGHITATGAQVPAKFRPVSNNSLQYMRAISNDIDYSGVMNVGTNGNLDAYLIDSNGNDSNYSGTSYTGFQKFSVSFHTS